MKKALITGITGQDGSYLAELLLSKGYEVHGMVRRASSFNTQRIEHLYQNPRDPELRLFLHYGDLTDGSRLTNLLNQILPDEIYNLAGQTHVRVSFDEPEYTGDTTGLGSIRLLEAMRQACPEAKYYQASSSEMFGAELPPQNENTRFHPRSPYGVAKAYSHWMTINYRESYGLFASNGILFNHESPRRGETFVTRKITKAVARISQGLQSELYLGNIEAKRDWGYAPEYVFAMWKILQYQAPEDFVIGSGSSVSVRQFLEMSFQHVGLDWEKYVKFDERYVRPAEVDNLIADASKAKNLLDWEASVSPTELSRIMVNHDIAALGGYIVDKPLGKLWGQP